MEAQTNSRSEHFSLIPIDQLIASKTNPRKHFGNLAELVDSVKQHGVIVPLIARTPPLLRNRRRRAPLSRR